MSPSGTRALVELLTRLFTTDDLHRVAASLPHGNVGADLPGGNASLRDVAFGLVDVLARRGYVDDALFARLAEERPGRADEIAGVRGQLVDADALPAPGPHRAIEAVPPVELAAHAPRRSPDLIDFTGERGRHEHFFGREDILRELDDWLRGRDSGWLLLTGSPGLGKSAIFHHWLGLRERAGLPAAFHFIRRGIQNWADPSVVRASLAAQIERDFPAQCDAEGNVWFIDLPELATRR